MKYSFTIITAFFFFCVDAQPEHASRRRNFNNENFVALREFDPVSYFTNNPLKGSSKYEYNHKGIIYYFASEANREAFKKSPEKYEPAYGGWCAFTVAQSGERVKVNPMAYKIIDGRLFLFYNFNGDNRLVKWNNGDQKKLKALADKNWLKKMH
jgi:YHS domain-containing protein